MWDNYDKHISFGSIFLLYPQREKFPIFTFAFESMEILKTIELRLHPDLSDLDLQLFCVVY